MTGRLSWRRLGVLVDALPRESASARATLGEQVEWGHVEHLLAAVVDVLAAANWQRAGNKNAPRPKPLRRPGQQEPGERRFRGRRSYTPAEIDALVAGRR